MALKWRLSKIAIRISRLLCLFCDKLSKVREVFGVVEGLRRWDLRWCGELYQGEKESLCELRRLLENVGLKDNNEEDKWVWMDVSTNFYSVSSSYKVLMS